MTSWRGWSVLMHLAALIASAGATSTIFSALEGSDGLRTYPLVFVVILAFAAIFGMPIYLLLRFTECANWKTAALGGFAVGAILPLCAVLLSPVDQASVDGVATVVDGRYTLAGWRQNFFVVGGFGLLGALGGMAFWSLLRLTLGAPDHDAARGPGPAVRAWRRMALLFAATCFGGAMFALPEITKDRSCHNTMRDGRQSIAPMASFNLMIDSSDWTEIAATIDQFARERHWEIQSDVRLSGFQWFQSSICHEPGTEIFANGVADEKIIFFDVFQPQGGNDWQEPFASLYTRIQKRWPDRIRFTGDQGQTIAQPYWVPHLAKRASFEPRSQ
jgi:hypothetical protein